MQSFLALSVVLREVLQQFLFKSKYAHEVIKTLNIEATV